MFAGIMLLWFTLTALSLAFVVIDIRKTPESLVLKRAFVILVVFTGPLGAFFYVLGCREPLAGTHAQYVSATWRQVLGSTMHCAAGDGLGIIAGAVVGASLQLSPLADFALEYVLGFGFGWAYFQAFAMKDMFGGAYRESLKATFLPELFSMNLLMAGMLPVMRWLMAHIEGAGDPLAPAFWFTMSMALIAGFLLAYPVNWWLVVNNMKHGMLTIARAPDDGHRNNAAQDSVHAAHGAHASNARETAAPSGNDTGHDTHRPQQKPTGAAIVATGLLSFAFLAGGVFLALQAGGG